MRKRCQLINVDVDVDVDANESSRQLVEDGITTRTWLVDSLFCVTCSLENNAFSVLDYVIFTSLNPFVTFFRPLQPHSSSPNWGKYENSRFNSDAFSYI